MIIRSLKSVLEIRDLITKIVRFYNPKKGNPSWGTYFSKFRSIGVLECWSIG